MSETQEEILSTVEGMLTEYANKNKRAKNLQEKVDIKKDIAREIFEYMQFRANDLDYKTDKALHIAAVSNSVCDESCSYWGYQCNINEMFKDCKKTKI